MIVSVLGTEKEVYNLGNYCMYLVDRSGRGGP